MLNNSIRENEEAKVSLEVTSMWSIYAERYTCIVFYVLLVLSLAVKTKVRHS